MIKNAVIMGNVRSRLLLMWSLTGQRYNQRQGLFLQWYNFSITHIGLLEGGMHQQPTHPPIPSHLNSTSDIYRRPQLVMAIALCVSQYRDWQSSTTRGQYQRGCNNTCTPGLPCRIRSKTQTLNPYWVLQIDGKNGKSTNNKTCQSN